MNNITPRTFVVSFLSLSLIGCSSLPDVSYVPQTTDISYPPLNNITTAYVGDDLVMQGTVLIYDAITVDNDIIIPHGTNITLISKGVYLKLGEDSKEIVYSAIPLGGTEKQTTATYNPPFAISIKKGSNKVFCAKYINGIFVGEICIDKFMVTKKTQEIGKSNSFQRTLIYNGRIGNKLNIGYRESLNGSARTSFSNNVEYDLNESNVIGYKGAKVKVIDASNSYIKYKLLRNFRVKNY